ncbi:ATP-binding cassette domain-containing protein [Microbacterium azadirachtae]|uniref:ATP-binding cassette domain-containing protein n=1 Tax=Microbacterium azadirachtae TaxID=582680 RepID=UPI0021D4DC90|nr:ATP-binding cassette domain-containing protein [Microbacterium azadirachtae]UXW85557.1 ATP-binding cassette domain-containing protein [Microbacterium azadirachtae]
MTDGQVLEFSHATKRFGVLTAVDDLSARIEPGAVTAFLGPNGAGKTTSLRMLLGQIRPTSGTATIGGVSHAELRHPLRTIGSVLEEAVYRPRRTAPRQLSIAAKANGIPLSRVDEVLSLVGLQNETETRIGAYSLGMRQRLSVAGALLGDPGALVLDEPANGLDPEGIRWMRLLMRRLADEGRTVLVSSHVLSEIEQIADNVLVLSKGRLVYADSIGKLSDPTTGSVVVDAEDRAALTTALSEAGLTFDVLRSGLTVHNTDAAAVGAVAASAGLALTTLQQRGPSLEEVFLDLVHGRRDPLTGSVPVLTAPAAEETPATDDAAEAAAAPDADAEGAGAPAAEDGTPSAGLFGAAVAVPAVAATGAGVAGLFEKTGPAAAEAGTVAIPTTRREAAEFAAAQSAQGDEEAEGSEEGVSVAADDAGDEGDEAAPAGADAAEGSEETSSDGVAPSDGEAAEGSVDAEQAPAEDDDEAPQGDEPGAASAEESSEDADSSAEVDGSESDDQDGSETPATDDGGEHAQPEVAPEQSAEDDQDSPDESTIAAGIALTAPVAADYTPGEPQHDAPLTHDADAADEAEGSALGSFETAALTIPAEATSVSFDDLITGVPSAVQSTEDDDAPEDAEPAAASEDGEAQDTADETSADEAPADDAGHEVDDAPTAATTVITTPHADDEFATPEPSTETTEIAGIEIFAALAEGRTQEIQVILDETPEEDDDLEDVTQGEIHHDEDPRAAAVSASLAAAARAFYTDDAPSYTPGPAAGEQPAADEHAPDEHAQGEHADGEHAPEEHHEGDRNDDGQHPEHRGN